jgi:hypothetical protein
MEDFVTLEISKKLKAKGFDRPCIYAYCKEGGWNKYTQKNEPVSYILRTNGNPFGSFYEGNNWNKEYKTNKNKIQCSAPTISQVLSWLRKEKNIHVDIDIMKPYPAAKLIYWGYKIVLIDKCEVYHFEWNSNSFEQAALAGIEFVLDNLI